MAIDVAAIMTSAEGRAQDMANDANAALQGALTVASSIVLLPPVPVTALPSLTIPTLPEAPVLEAVDAPDALTLPVKPVLQAVTDGFSSIQAPAEPAGQVPAVVEPQRPPSLAGFSGKAPVLNMAGIASLPQAPAAFAQNAPTITAVSIPTAPNLQALAFDGKLPADPVSPPDVRAAFSDAYRSGSAIRGELASGMYSYLDQINPEFRSQISEVESKLRNYMAGGTALNPVVEGAIYERSKSRVDGESRRVQSDALKAAARRGFTLPDGALMTALQQARQAGADNNSKASVDIAIAQAEMEQKNLQFALNASIDLRKAAMSAAVSYHQGLVAINGQAVQLASSMVQALVQTHDMAIKVYAAKLDGYRADASVFEALVRASQNEIEIYRAQIEAAKVTTDVDMSRVQVYRSQIDAHQAAVDAYGKNVQAIVSLAELEKLQIDAFRAQVDAYAAEVQANTSEWHAYSAAWNGEEAKVKAHLAQAQIYASKVDGYKARIEAEAARLRVQSDANKSSIEAYSAEVHAMGAQAQANAQVVSARINSQDSMVRAYQAQSNAIVATANVASEQYRATSSVEIEKARLQMTVATEQARILSQMIDAQAKTSTAVGGVYAQMAGAALSGVNALAVGEQA